MKMQTCSKDCALGIGMRMKGGSDIVFVLYKPLHKNEQKEK
jgi:hypothetical protein